MSTIATFEHIRHRPLAGVAVLPRLSVFQFSLGKSFRLWLLMLSLGVALAAAVVYVIAVNLILLGGEGIRKDQAWVRELEREKTRLENLLAQQQSPSWLEAQSRADGLVEIDGLRYLITDQPVALSQFAP